MEAVSAAPTSRFSRAGVHPRARALRTTLVLPENLDRKIEAFCATNRISKNAGMLQLLSESLRKQGFRPEETPVLQVHYKRVK
jgi:hypothetical protein